MVAIALLVLVPLYDAIAGVGFSHAYFGGYRHAFTVGFISMMIGMPCGFRQALDICRKAVPVGLVRSRCRWR
jgi:hypothetical protein